MKGVTELGGKGNLHLFCVRFCVLVFFCWVWFFGFFWLWLGLGDRNNRWEFQHTNIAEFHTFSSENYVILSKCRSLIFIR